MNLFCVSLHWIFDFRRARHSFRSYDFYALFLAVPFIADHLWIAIVLSLQLIRVIVNDVTIAMLFFSTERFCRIDLIHCFDEIGVLDWVLPNPNVW